MVFSRFVKQDQVVIARLQTSGVICLETFKEFPQMARFTLRDEGLVHSDPVCALTSVSLFSLCLPMQARQLPLVRC